ncbi:hypothetical protein GUITHDRAFT_91230 [Guillardia theta CCMP2712]|uniref:Glutaredoxin-like protein n=1 Tax=Guillardia theta (strain CCMP2712) TaxID=905079 RepID=L1I4V8_GUITC|nr:hypothetical protein GUITHDRAFT_91230 [Guillardia theta CCMP2712]EKX31288.1 hypothetical protein GUITHDRAFT_91230 [Guillardia theta CCMP2712]|eukprot:XP_005818268.1 hypothetical protein GUITHDRAFT_91230 [Guillardia theta CCMP2712]
MCDASAEQRVSVTGSVYEGPPESPRVTLFTKADCTLCDKVKVVLKDCKESHPHSLSQIDITDPEHEDWWKRYKYDIPVLHLNGLYWTKHKLDMAAAGEALEAARNGSFKQQRGEPDASRLEH